MFDLALQLGPSSAVPICENSIQESVGRSAAPCELVRQHSTRFHWIFAVEFHDLPGYVELISHFLCMAQGFIMLRMAVKGSVNQRSNQFTTGLCNIPQKQ